MSNEPGGQVGRIPPNCIAYLHQSRMIADHHQERYQKYQHLDSKGHAQCGQLHQTKAIACAKLKQDQRGIECHHAQGHYGLDQIIELQGGGQGDEAEHPGEHQILRMGAGPLKIH